jgi:uncharacterized Tic20 family protein
MSFCSSCGNNIDETSTFCGSCGAQRPVALTQSANPNDGVTLAKLERDARQWAMFLHLSVLGGFLIPLAGLVAPIVIWQMKKDELPLLDAHGRNAMNWIISEVIYWTISFVLAFVLIGMPMLGILGLLSIIFPVVAAVKANNGVVWKYPMAIPFLRSSTTII